MREWPLLVVLAVVAGGLAVVVLVGFAPGTLVIGFGLLLGGTLRLLLPVRRAGLLVVRSRPFDIAVLYVLGALLVLLAGAVPRPG